MTASTVYYQYGSFVHPAGEVIDCRYSIRRSLNARNQGTIADVTTQLDILALGCTPYEIQTREAAIYAAYTQDNQKFAMYLPDGTLSKLIHDNTGSHVVTPPRVTMIAFPEAKQTEYATRRLIQIQIDSKVLMVDDEIEVWVEEFQHVGTALSLYVFQNTNNGPVLYDVWPQTSRLIIQSGHTVGLEGWVDYNIIAARALYPTIVGPTWMEHTGQRVITNHAPITMEGAGTDVKRFHYRTDWRFVWETTEGINIAYPTYAP